jgi:hypothetical protein
MSDLYELAQDLFYEYSKKENKVANWQYLNDERKLAWMEEVVVIWDKLLVDLQSQIRPANTSPQSTSYAMGYNEAVKAERRDFLDLLDRANNKLKEQLEQFIEDSRN